MEPFPEDWQRALFIVAHPDDPEYGGAAAVARWTDQGKEIAYLLVTRGEAGIDSIPPDECGPLRAEEQVRAAAEVGVDTVEFLDGHPDGVIEYSTALRRDLAGAIRRHRPDVVLGLNYHDTFPGGALNMADHTAVGRAVPDACRDASNRWVFNDQLVDGLEPWDGVRLVGSRLRPSRRTRRTSPRPGMQVSGLSLSTRDTSKRSEPPTTSGPWPRRRARPSAASWQWPGRSSTCSRTTRPTLSGSRGCVGGRSAGAARSARPRR